MCLRIKCLSWNKVTWLTIYITYQCQSIQGVRDGEYIKFGVRGFITTSRSYPGFHNVLLSYSRLTSDNMHWYVTWTQMSWNSFKMCSFFGIKKFEKKTHFEGIFQCLGVKSNRKRYFGGISCGPLLLHFHRIMKKKNLLTPLNKSFACYSCRYCIPLIRSCFSVVYCVTDQPSTWQPH